MTFGTNAKIVSRLVSGNFSWLIALSLGTSLSGCASLTSYEQSLEPSHLAASARPSSAVLREAEARGYDQGLAAGKRIQARQDRTIAQAQQARVSAAASQAAAAMAQEAVEESQDIQAIRSICEPPSPAAKPGAPGGSAAAPSNAASPLPNAAPIAPVTGTTQAASARMTPRNTGSSAFATTGPARPLGTPADPF
jgi:hypothetical protein